jgi:hypothetical protein
VLNFDLPNNRHDRGIRLIFVANNLAAILVIQLCTPTAFVWCFPVCESQAPPSRDLLYRFIDCHNASGFELLLSKHFNFALRIYESCEAGIIPLSLGR